MPKKITTEIFVKEAELIHGKNVYTYERTIYKNAKEKVEIYCCSCNCYFWQTPNAHKRGQGCPICANKKISNRFSSTKEYFIKRATKIHNNDYNYDQVKYVNAHIKIKILCNRCNCFFKQKPTNHLSGNGCPKCAIDKTRIGKEEFIRRAKSIHGDIYNYDEVIYINTNTKVKIWCWRCNEFFYQSPLCHLTDHGHSECCSDIFSPTEYGKVYKKAKLYIIKCFNLSECFYKIGITSKSLNNRFVKLKDYNYEILFEKELSGYNARKSEIELHKLHKQYKYIPNIKFSGYTECFNKIDFNLVDKITKDNKYGCY